ncbi:unnamed protein product [Schistosoma rodhaini]|nr:unnamed protein product [Schistosoma rodhaini]CAH8538794.1 unnamed protein product [Schistosoma rodhaini]
MTIIRKLHIYLTDTNFIGFDILQKAINRWYQSNNEFKYMVTKLIHLTDFQHPLTSNKQSISSLSSSPPPSGDNIETLIAKATRRNTIVYSTTAENEDLQQLMNMFKPFFKSDTIISMDTNNTQIDHHILTLNDYLNKFDHWINKTKMINELINKRQAKFNYIHLINEQLIQLDNHLRVVFENYPLYTCKGLPNKVITMMELLVTQITYTLPAQPIFLGNKETQVFIELEDHDKPTTGAQSKQTRSHRMKLVIHLMKIINLLLSYILPIFTQSNRNLNLLNKDQIKITVDEIIIKKKLEGVIQRLIEQLIQLPCVINDFSLNEFNKQSVQQSNCFQIELETWIRRYEMEKLDIMSKKFICVNQWQQEVFNKDLHTVTTSTLRSIFKSHIEIGIFIHQLNYQISYLFTELISNTSSILNRTTNNNTRTIHQEEDWIKQIIHRIIIKSKKSILYLLDCFLSHSYTTFSIIHSKVRNYSLTTTTTPTPTTTTTAAAAAAAIHSVLISTSNIEQKQEQSIATIIRSLFIIDWLTSQYPYLIQLLIKELGYNDLIHIYNTQCIISLIDQLNKRSTFNLIQIKLIKCILIALINRLNEKFNITNDIS